MRILSNNTMTWKQGLIFIIVITIVTFLAMQLVYGQSVDDLIQDHKQNIQELKQKEAYRQELINRINNSTCMTYGDHIPTMQELYDMYGGKKYYEREKTDWDVPLLEEKVRYCVDHGWIN